MGIGLSGVMRLKFVCFFVLYLRWWRGVVVGRGRPRRGIGWRAPLLCHRQGGLTVEENHTYK